MVTTIIDIPGYKVSKPLYDGSRTVVYRAFRKTDSLAVVIKLLKNPYPSFQELVQFRNQYTIVKNFNFPGIIQAHSLEPFQNGYALVMEDFGGISLKDYFTHLDTGHVTFLQEFLQIAIALCDILDELHRHRVIHKDIKPANILINQDTKQVKLIDFSIASLLPKEAQEIKSPNVLEGTLAYISPEQTGRMNRGIDYRSDFYSLGVTFYELLNRKLPFPSDEPMELVHCHIAKTPEPIQNPAIPQVITDIVMKLMAKNAEDRYQSALGLKHDLAKCLSQLHKLGHELGEITYFEIGKRDTCDRFLIPEKLYGRENEVQELLAAFDRVAGIAHNYPRDYHHSHSLSVNTNSKPLNLSQKTQLGSQGKAELILVAGFSGIGKTAIVNEVHKPIVQQRGYFIKGKFDQFNRNIPLDALVQAFRDLIGQLLCESDAQLQSWKLQILEALGENAQVIIDVIPELAQIIGEQSPAPELSGTAAQNRFNLLFQKFIQVFTQPEHPLVMFLDDLQWADSASLNLLQLLMAESGTGYLLMIGAYRDNEVFAAHPFILTLDAIAKTGTKINTITLKPLSESSLNQLVADTLKSAITLAQPLTKLVYQKTQGNPFFATQFIKALYQEQLITFDPQARHWQCDIARVREAALTDDVVEFMALQLQKLPKATQNVLKLAACIGNQFDLKTLAIVAEESTIEMATALWSALQEGLILSKSEIYKFYIGEVVENIQVNTEIADYKFLHDRVQQAAYSLIPEAEKPATHLKIGQLLFNESRTCTNNATIFEIVNQLNLGRQLIRELPAIWQLAELNVTAGRQAKQSTAYSSAVNYFQTAIQLLAASVWERDYPLALSLYTDIIEATYLNGDFETMERLLSELQKQAKTNLDLIKAQEIQIEALVAQGKLLESLNLGLGILAQFGIKFPQTPTLEDYTTALERARQAIGDRVAALQKHRTTAELIDLPLATDEQAIAVMRVLVKLAAPAFLAAPPLYPLLPYCGVELSARVGVSGASAYLFACYGLLHCAMLDDYKAGYEFGQLALALCNKLGDQEFQARAFFMNGLFITHWTGHLRDSLPQLQSGYTTGLDTGDSAYTGYSAYSYCCYAYFLGQPLPNLLPEMERYQQALQKLNQGAILNYHNIYYQIVLNLLGESNSICTLAGDIYNEAEMLPLHQSANDYVALVILFINKLILNFWFGNWEIALEASNMAEKYLGGAAAVASIPLYYFYDSLTRLTYAHKLAPADSSEYNLRIEQNLEKLTTWAKYAPMNHQHKLDLVKAEQHRFLQQNSAAIELYDKAIVGAKENGYLQEEALANELAAKFYLDWGKEKVAAGYMQEAYYCYTRWGAKAKVAHLEENYPQLLAAILQVPTLPFNYEGTIASTVMRSVTNVSSSHNSWLDFPVVMKAAQAISQEIELEKLLATLMQTTISAAGAEIGRLILRQDKHQDKHQDKEWFVVAQANTQQTQRLEISLGEFEEIPQSLIYTVARSQETAVFENLSAVVQFASDRYISSQQPKSVLCTPISQKGKVIGILYLENNLTVGAFTSDRLQVIQLLTTQAAISLENAQLYCQLEEYSHTLEQKVSERTQELTQKATQLESTLQELQRTQTQLIQSEKMSSLGQLVAGIAHEINNPVNFIHGNINHLKQYMQDLLYLVNISQQSNPHPVKTSELVSEIDIDFIQEDLPKTLKSMEVGTERIREIVLSLRTFSRMDEAEFKKVDIHTGIDSTIMILQHRLKETSEHPAIQIIKNYDQLPLVECYAGQLNQVFMNILTNAIDAINEKNSKLNFAEIAATPHQITIRTLVIDNDWIEIAIADNGIGIPEKVKHKVFNPFFTTKPVGKGTGMGMSISYQIITEKHGGKLECFSIPNQGTEFVIKIPIHQ
ncbi:AAA family ATPase [Calothrix sp. UHCC 0171]|uniref:trifunctional serine/threonine-protein kinase/ATP-binding protein/sensor histidine kinase n=1 Tax=Calothrix sp. UHCC 0171 TaxID=3110245 RepID=UPI002B1F2B44|nr:AAA family ATPase [Calothrix sp. UHCC 0171]MEA5574477.1 AAA family ATPase [Calothrix sp. UHCC 0171]